jgi:hypothetical protein
MGTTADSGLVVLGDGAVVQADGAPVATTPVRLPSNGCAGISQYLYCNDFESYSDVTTGWVQTKAVKEAATVTLVADHSVSPQHGAHFTMPDGPHDLGGGTCAYNKLSQNQTQPFHRMRLGFAVWLERLQSNDEGEAVFMFSFDTGDSTQGETLLLRASNATFELFEQTGKVGAYNQQAHPIGSGAPPMKQWLYVSETIDLDAHHATVTVTADPKDAGTTVVGTAQFEFLAPVPPPATTNELAIGFSCMSAGAEAFYDDVVEFIDQ